MLIKLLFLSFICIKFVITHSTKYTDLRRNETCYNPTPAKILSWHIHVLYWQSNEAHSLGARKLMNEYKQAFSQNLGPDCNSTFHMEYMCMFNDVAKPDGPFLTAQWSVFIPVEHFSRAVAWIMQHRGEYDVLVHPNTGCEIEDHSWWAFWGGKPWEIDFDVFSYDYPFPWTKEMDDKADPILIADDENSILASTFLKENPLF